MLLVVLFVVLAVSGCIVTHLYSNSCHGFWDHDVWSTVGAVGCVLGFTGLVVSAFLGLRVQINKDVDYQVALNERDALVYRLEHREDNMVGNEMLYSEVTEFNNGLLSTKKWADSPWIGCFFNEKIADLDYIEYREG